MDMNVEDEYYSIIESRDTDIMLKNRELAESAAKLKMSNEQLKESKEQLKLKDVALNKSIKMLLNAGLNPEDIATTLSIDLSLVLKGKQ